MSFSLLRSGLVAAAGMSALAAGEPAPAFHEIRKIDVHTHVFGELPELNAYMRDANIRVLNVCNRGTEGHVEIMHRAAVDLYRKHPELYPFYSTFDLLRRDEPGYVQDVIRTLDETFAQGAIGVKIWKDMGLVIKDREGKFILPDNPLFDPIYAHIAKRGKVLLAHLGEPIDAWRPMNPASLYYASYQKSQQWYFHGKPEYPSHEAIMAARDNILRQHPDLIVIGAHFGSLEHDLDGAAARLEKYPNFHLEVSARTPSLARHPAEKVRALFLKHADRILYGQDAIWKPYLNPAHRSASHARGHINWRKLNYEADFNYYAGRGEVTHAGCKVQALNLPRAVLEKFYHENAERIFHLKQVWQREPAE
jgi:predicted TIM-barrel fold metal-dependent hydrolase